MHLVRSFITGCVLALALSGCVGEAQGAPIREATPTPARTSPFATNDEALAAATAAFQRYVDISNTLANDPSSDLAQLDRVEATVLAARERDRIASERKTGTRRSGAASFDTVRFENASIDAEHQTHVSVFLCVDVSATKVSGPDGSDITPAIRDDRAEARVGFVTTAPDATTLIIERSEFWSHTGSC